MSVKASVPTQQYAVMVGFQTAGIGEHLTKSKMATRTQIAVTAKMVTQITILCWMSSTIRSWNTPTPALLVAIPMMQNVCPIISSLFAETN